MTGTTFVLLFVYPGWYHDKLPSWLKDVIPLQSPQDQLPPGPLGSGAGANAANGGNPTANGDQSDPGADDNQNGNESNGDASEESQGTN